MWKKCFHADFFKTRQNALDMPYSAISACHHWLILCYHIPWLILCYHIPEEEEEEGKTSFQFSLNKQKVQRYILHTNHHSPR
jgi:hypothetical protein